MNEVVKYLGLFRLLLQTLEDAGCRHLDLAEVRFRSVAINRDRPLSKLDLLVAGKLRLRVKRRVETVHYREIVFQMTNEFYNIRLRIR